MKVSWLRVLSSSVPNSGTDERVVNATFNLKFGTICVKNLSLMRTCEDFLVHGNLTCASPSGSLKNGTCRGSRCGRIKTSNTLKPVERSCLQGLTFRVERTQRTLQLGAQRASAVGPLAACLSCVRSASRVEQLQAPRALLAAASRRGDAAHQKGCYCIGRRITNKKGCSNAGDPSNSTVTRRLVLDYDIHYGLGNKEWGLFLLVTRIMPGSENKNTSSKHKVKPFVLV